jgi:hypothetical protein
MNKMMKILKLAKDRKRIMKESLEGSLGIIKNNLYNLNGTSKDDEVSKTWYDKYLNELRTNVQGYKDRSNNSKKNFGVKFPELQKQYEEMLPEINKYLGVKN